MSKRDRDAGPRRFRVMYAVGMQTLFAILLLGLAWWTRAQPRTPLLYLAAAILPVGWALALWIGWQRDEKARAAGTWTPESYARETKRVYGWMGALLVAAVALLMAVYLLA